MKPIHNLLRQRLYRTQKALIEHPPIDLLSAFSERALSGPDHVGVLEHLSQCGDCRQIIFLAAPESSAGFSATTSLPSASRWISLPVFRWGTVAACAVIVVAAVRLRPTTHPSYTAATVAATANQQPSPKVTGAVATASEPNSPALQSRAERVGIDSAAAAPRPHTIPGKAKDAPQTSGAPSATALTTDGAFRKTTAKLSPRWTVTAEGTLQRSLDGGINWQQVEVSRGRVFRSVAAEGRSIWLGGLNGALFHSADAGQHWTQVKGTPERPLPHSDIVGIQFDDQDHGKLTTASSESWTTSDAGRTWEIQ